MNFILNIFSFFIKKNDTSPTKSLSNDVVEKFCLKHMDKIRAYITTLKEKIPIPIIDTGYEENSANSSLNKTLIKNTQTSKNTKSKKKINLKFTCFNPNQTESCLFSHNFFEMLSTNCTTWIHVIFLAIQAQTLHPLSQFDSDLVELRHAYERLGEKMPFSALLTSSFPSEKVISSS
jgi:hypothetical protein